MNKVRTAIRLLKEERNSIKTSIVINFFKWLPDTLYLKLVYRFKIGHRLNLKKPKTFTEKIQWLKLYNRRPEYTTMVDKYAVKQYVAALIGADHIIPTLGVWNKVEDIDWDSLPDQFVLKTTHGGGGGGVVICKDKSSFDRKLAIDKLKLSLASDIYLNLREWPYKNVPKRIIAEKFIAPGGSSATTDLPDYKFFCFNGKVKFFKVDFGRFMDHHANYYSPAGVLQEFGEKEYLPNSNYPIVLPDNLNEMVSLAERLSQNELFLRVDFYSVNGKIYFGELTFYPASGLGKFTPEEWDERLGDLIVLPTVK